MIDGKNRIRDIARMLYRNMDSNNDLDARDLRIRINKLLIASGDVVDTALGRVETLQGRNHGLSGMYCQTEDNKYWVILCNDAGTKYILDLFYKKYPELRPSRKSSVAEKPEAKAAAPVPARKEEPAAPKMTCKDCSDYRCGQCFGKDRVCPDFRKALTLSEEEKSRWPTEGDASFIREHGMSRKRFDFIHRK